MRCIYLCLLAFVLPSCFLFPKFKKEQLSFSEDGVQKNYAVIVPKGYHKKEKLSGATGNEEFFYHYPGGSVLYFARVKDTGFQYQPINYEVNQPVTMFNSVFFKGIDSSHKHYWRESRASQYKAGYRKAETGEEWRFDSALNYFTLRLPLNQ